MERHGNTQLVLNFRISEMHTPNFEVYCLKTVALATIKLICAEVVLRCSIRIGRVHWVYRVKQLHVCAIL